MEAISISQALEVIADQLIDDKISIFVEYINQLESRIDQLETQNNKDYLQQKEVFQAFGIGHKTLKTWVYKGLDEIWIGNRVYYSRTDIERYLEKNKTCPPALNRGFNYE